MILSSSNKATFIDSKQEIVIINPEVSEVVINGDNETEKTQEWWEV